LHSVLVTATSNSNSSAMLPIWLRADQFHAPGRHVS